MTWLLIASLWGGWGGGWGGGWSQSDSLGVVITGLGTYTSAVVKDSMMYVAQVGAYGPGDGLMKIYNISDPSTPVLRSSTSVAFQGYNGRKIAVRNNLAYVLTPMSVYNVKNHASPSLLSSGTGNHTSAKIS